MSLKSIVSKKSIKKFSTVNTFYLVKHKYIYTSKVVQVCLCVSVSSVRESQG